MKNYLYVIGAFKPKATKPDAVKIGIAANVEKRLLDLQCGNHLKLEIIRTYTLLSRKSAEKAEFNAHRYLAAHRIGGEWFQPVMDRINNATQDAVAKARGIGGEIHIEIPA